MPVRSPSPPAGTRQRLASRSAQLPISSRALYRIESSVSLPGVAITVMVAVFALVASGAALGLSPGWVAGLEIGLSAMTLVMVFAIQHTQAREQAATQRKLDELLRAVPEANSGLMMLEEAPQAVMLDVAEDHRHARQSDADPAEP